MKPPTLFALATLLATALTSCGGSDSAADKPATDPTPAPSSNAPAAFNLSGSIAITDPAGFYADGNYAGAGCTGDSGFDDVQAGAQVVIRDSAGKQVALGELGPGSTTGKLSAIDTTCEFTLLVFDIPEGDDIYTVEVSHRGEISFTRDEGESGLHMTLG